MMSQYHSYWYYCWSQKQLVNEQIAGQTVHINRSFFCLQLMMMMIMISQLACFQSLAYCSILHIHHTLNQHKLRHLARHNLLRMKGNEMNTVVPYILYVCCVDRKLEFCSMCSLQLVACSLQLVACSLYSLQLVACSLQLVACIVCSFQLV